MNEVLYVAFRFVERGIVDKNMAEYNKNNTVTDIDRQASIVLNIQGLLRLLSVKQLRTLWAHYCACRHPSEERVAV
jgi:hypothetical protein